MSEPAGRGRSARVWRVSAGIVAGALILGALALGALRFALARVPENAARIQQWVEQQTQLRLEFTGIDARLRGFGPEVVMSSVRVLDRDGTQALFETREATVGLDVWNFFRTGDLVAGRVRFGGPEVTLVRLADGRIRLLGQRERTTDRPPFDLDRLPAGRLEIDDATVHYRDLKTGRGPWTLQQVGLSLQRARDSVEVAGSARLPRELGSLVAFEGSLSGSLDHFDQLEARVALDFERLDIAGVAQLLPAAGARPLSGAGPVSAVMAVSKGRIDQLRLEVALADVAIDLPLRNVPTIQAVEISEPYREPGASALSMPIADKSFVERPATGMPGQARYSSLAGQFRLRREGRAWTFRASDVVTQREPGQAASKASLAGRWTGHPASAFELRLDASGLNVADAWPLVLATAPPGFDRWAGLQPSGAIRGVRAEIVRDRAGSEPRFAVSGSVADLALRPIARWPGLSGLTASFSGTEQRGRLALRAESPSVEWPRLFRAPISAQRVDADIDWRRDGAAWIVASDDASVIHPQASAGGSFELHFGLRGRSPVLTLEAHVDRLEAALVPHVLPVGRLQPRSIVWMERAFQGGVATNGRVSYRGPVRKFPFRQGEGEFVASADVSDGRLDFLQGFAPLSGAAGSVEFRNAGLRAELRAGSVGGLRLLGAEVAIEDLKAPTLEIEARASGDLAKALAVVQGSPLGPQLGAQFMQLTGAGPADYELRLMLPTQDVEQRDYTVRTRLHGASVSLPALRAPATRVTGELEIHNYEVRAEALRGMILDGPFELAVQPGPVGGAVTASVRLQGSGRAAGARLPGLIGLPETVGMSGVATWQLEGVLERRGKGAQWPARFAVKSDLRGLGIDAPSPFGKVPAEVRPTRVALELVGRGRNEVRIESGAARAVLAFAERDARRWDLERGAARFDGETPGLPSRPGLHVAGDWPEFDLGEWLALRPAKAGERRLSDWLGPVDVHLDRAQVLGFEFLDVTARMEALAEAWRIQVSGPSAEGVIMVPVDFSGPQRLDLDLRRLVLQSAKQRARSASVRESDPRELPALSVRVDEFSWQGRRFGELRAQVDRDPRGLRLASFATQSADFSLTGKGSWLVEDSSPRTRLSLELSSGDLAAASRALGYREAVDAERVAATASLSWPGGPAEDAIARMDGTLHLELGRGQLRGVNPGAGRMLGLMSIVELPRRLSLDFRDVTDEGLSFDTVRGDFEVRAGNAYTHNLLLQGAAVDIGVVGRTGLATQDYEQTIVVSGNPSGPITVAGALAAGPVGAAGALLISQLFKGQLQGLARVYYRVSGPWSDPTVERISATAGGNVAAGSSATEDPPP